MPRLKYKLPPTESSTVDLDTTNDESLHQYGNRKKRKRMKRPKVKCSHCGYGTRNTEHMGDHVMNFHLRVSSYKCHRCEFDAIEKNILVQHKKEDHPLARSRQACEMCGYTCGSVGLLNRHKLLCHSKDCPWTCSLCAFVSRTEAELTRHVERAHRVLNRYICGICGHRSSSNGLIKVHILKKHLRAFHSAKKSPLSSTPK